MKRILYILIGLGFIGGAIGYQMYNKPHQNIENAATDIAVPASEIFNSFENDETAAGTKYNDKIVAVSGKISDIGTDDDGTLKITLDAGGDFGGVICQMEPDTDKANFSIGQDVTLKGKCTGYLMDVIIVRCVSVK